jgi:hypothetical protein
MYRISCYIGRRDVSHLLLRQETRRIAYLLLRQETRRIASLPNKKIASRTRVFHPIFRLS